MKNNNVRLGKTQYDNFRKKCIEEVEKTAKARHKNVCLESEADYFAGAMTVMALVNEQFFGADEESKMNITAPMWFLGPMTGRSITKDWK
tara:strand:+ start:4460 stop:4729 length:270 start_codon:yes stop_codon:yes gene_type:complete